MPGRDGTGPFGFGAMTGRGFGFCSGSEAGRYGLGLGLGYGCRRGRFFNVMPSESMEKESLSAERDFLEARLSAIKKNLDRT
ncbi:MAG: DUF5320 domain-containing protein [Eubacteriales bacterium]|nr:DUF5320 domain-containing protein [Eubacteriales bacterium]